MFRLPPPHRVREILAASGHAGDDALSYELERRIFGRVLAMGLPSIASFLLLTVYDLIDVFWLARLGEAPVAAVTVFGALKWLLAFPNQIIGTGSVALISQRFGQDDREGTELAIKNTFLGKFLVGSGMGLVGYVFLPDLMRLFGAAPDVVELGTVYGWIPCLGMGISLASFSVYTALRGVGRPALGMWASVVGTVVNLVLDPLLIFGIGPFPRMGVLGAAVASMAGFVTVTAIGLILLAGPLSPIRVRWFRGPHAGGRMIVRMMRIGLPSGGTSLSFSLAGSIVVKLVATYGTTVVALFGMSQKVLHLGIVVISGLGLGTSALVGQYLGSHEPNKAWIAAKLNARTGLLAMFTFALAVSVLAPQIVRAFFDDPSFVEPGALYLRVLALSLPFLGMSSAAEQAYAGAGRNLPPMFMHAASSWLFAIPLMYLTGRVLEWDPAWMLGGQVMGHALGAVIGLRLLAHGAWLTHRV